MMRVIQISAAVRVDAAQNNGTMWLVVMMGVVLAFQDHAVSKAGTRAAQHHEADEQNQAGGPQQLLCPVVEHTHD